MPILSRLLFALMSAVLFLAPVALYLFLASFVFWTVIATVKVFAL